MRKQFRIGNSNTFLVSKINNSDDSKITFALEYRDKVSNEKKLKICGHYHDKSKILNRETINSDISCPDCKKKNVSSSLIGIPIDEKDFEILYLYGKDYYHKKYNKEKYNKLYSDMYNLLNNSSNNKKETDNYIQITETFNKVRKEDDDDDEEQEEEIFILFLVKKNIIYGFYTSLVSSDSSESLDGFLYIPENFQEVEGYCKMVIKKALDIQKNIINIKKMNIGNIKSWRDVFCNFHGAVENKLKIYFDNSEQFLEEDIDLPTLDQMEQDFLEFRKILQSGNLEGGRYEHLKDHVISTLERNFYASEDYIEALTSTLDDLGYESNIYVSVFDEMIPRNFYFSNE